MSMEIEHWLTTLDDSDASMFEHARRLLQARYELDSDQAGAWIVEAARRSDQQVMQVAEGITRSIESVRQDAV